MSPKWFAQAIVCQGKTAQEKFACRQCEKQCTQLVKIGQEPTGCKEAQ